MVETYPPITSRDNPVFKRVRSLQRPSSRNAERAFVVEGTRAVRDALETGARPQLVLVSTDFDSTDIASSLDSSRQTRRIVPALLAKLTDTISPQGVVAVFPFPEPPTPGTSPELTLVADSVSDPGNLGTLLRSAAAAGSNRVLLTPGTVDPFNSKVVRSAMGAHFRVPIARFDPDFDEYPATDVQIVLLSGEAQTAYDQVDLTGPIWIVVGSEARGAGERLREAATQIVSIPMSLGTESLNAAVAGSILLFEAVRQRRRDVIFAESPRHH
ncbi:MAG: TrmH family RNA methyltransferase [Thermomicrobiales bacterium]